MIYTISLNSSIDYTFYLRDIVFGDINRVEKSRVDAGGKGLNVAKTLKCLGSDCTAITFLGGDNGKRLEFLLKKDKINYEPVVCAGNIRNIFNFVCKNKVLRINEKGPQINRTEESKILALIKRIKLKEKDILCMSGSLPPGMKKNTYRKIIDATKKKGAVTVVDADGAVLRESIKAEPSVIKPNLWELERAAGEKINSFSSLTLILKNLKNKGIFTILLTFGESGAVIFSGRDFLFAVPPKVKVSSTVGCGDSFLAGYLHSLCREENPRENLKMAVAAGAAKACEEGTKAPALEKIRENYNKVRVYPSGTFSSVLEKLLKSKPRPQ
jgi:1-phosphofructokinase